MSELDKRITLKGTERVCDKCLISKELTENFRYKVTHNCFTKSCLECINTNRRISNKEKCKNFISDFEYDNTVRKCRVCKEEYKNIDGFHLHKHSKCYLATCKKCINRERRRKKSLRDIGIEPESKKIKSREFTITDKARLIVNTYNFVDSNKGFESHNLSVEYIESILNTPCTYCGFPSTGLDRISNFLGHTLENTVPCCRECNLARNTYFTHEEMKEIGKTLSLIKKNRT